MYKVPLTVLKNSKQLIDQLSDIISDRLVPSEKELKVLKKAAKHVELLEVNFIWPEKQH